MLDRYAARGPAPVVATGTRILRGGARLEGDQPADAASKLTIRAINGFQLYDMSAVDALDDYCRPIARLCS